MSVLPASVRVGLWASAALNAHADLDGVASQALPDMDDVSGLTPVLSAWRDVGERVVLVALPTPGRTSGMPPGPPALVDAAAEAQEMLFVPSVGGALVPHVQAYGPDQDQGWAVHWQAHPSDPVPRHVVEAMSVADVELQLRTVLAELTEKLTLTPGSPMAGAAAEVFARRRVNEHWGLPRGMPPRCVKVIELAGSVITLADIGLAEGMQSVDSAGTVGREVLLRRLHHEAAVALATATNVASMSYAGWV